MNKKSIRRQLAAQYHKERSAYYKIRSAWKRGVLLYAEEMLDSVCDSDEKITEHLLLNGADNWRDYSYGGFSLIYDEDICYRLCAPWEIKRKRGGALPPNRRDTWLDVQAVALYQAARLIMKIANE